MKKNSSMSFYSVVIFLGILLLVGCSTSKQQEQKPQKQEKAPADKKVADKKAPADKKVADEKAPADKKVADEKAPADKKVADEKAPADKKVADEKIVDKEKPMAEDKKFGAEAKPKTDKKVEIPVSESFRKFKGKEAQEK